MADAIRAGMCGMTEAQIMAVAEFMEQPIVDEQQDAAMAIRGILMEQQVENMEAALRAINKAVFVLNNPGVDAGMLRQMETSQSEEDAHEMVMLSKVKGTRSGTKAQGRRSTANGAKTDLGRESAVPTASGTLGEAMSAIKRLPKPRTKSKIDEVLWAAALDKARAELKQQHNLQSEVEDYYDTMCDLGKSLLAAEVQRRTQSLYDYKASKKQSRDNRKLSHSEQERPIT